ncbi:helix-turn-helix transcriptional regulator [Anaerococcus provencensis]|uniref:helix-turn-helix transcriptional regulator n=1 Tax=Anaerococcus provencensis TaxID=938293 RepID=UPI000301D467|nr:helix-turn-helix transcriptional regulator [Anaerococcus provencensis]
MKTQDPMAVELGNVISAARKKRGYSQEEFAYLIGISVRALSKIENGYNYPSLITASLISEFLGFSIDSIIKSSSNNPELHINVLFSQFLYYMDNRDYESYVKICKTANLLSSNIRKNTIYYKKYLFIKSWDYIIKNDIRSGHTLLNEAYKINKVKSEENQILDYRIFLVIQTIYPDLFKNEDDIIKASLLSIDRLSNMLENLDSYPDLKMKYLYSILMIAIENLEDYNMSVKYLVQLIKISSIRNHLIIYYQSIFYRGLVNYLKGAQDFYIDLDDSLMYFFISGNDDFFKHNTMLIRNKIINNQCTFS